MGDDAVGGFNEQGTQSKAAKRALPNGFLGNGGRMEIFDGILKILYAIPEVRDVLSSLDKKGGVTNALRELFYRMENGKDNIDPRNFYELYEKKTNVVLANIDVRRFAESIITAVDEECSRTKFDGPMQMIFGATTVDIYRSDCGHIGYLELEVIDVSPRGGIPNGHVQSMLGQLVPIERVEMKCDSCKRKIMTGHGIELKRWPSVLAVHTYNTFIVPEDLEEYELLATLTIDEDDKAYCFIKIESTWYMYGSSVTRVDMNYLIERCRAVCKSISCYYRRVSPPHIVSMGPDYGLDFDAIYEDDCEDELANVQEHGSVVMHLLSQLSVGMDLTKITLPTFILERRSLLEMFADFFAHPDLYANIADGRTPEDRMTAVVKWYLSSFHAGRKSSVAKKPYNPILGEIFHCRWDVPLSAPSQETEQDGSPFPGARTDQVTFIAEQVSHHPPVSAFYAELPNNRLQLNGHIWTKSKFLGDSLGVDMVGQACLSVLDYDEEYIITFPSGYGRSILTTPWVELVGKCTINCEKTGYYADVEFQAKPFYGGRAHCVKADAYRPARASSMSVNKNPYLSVRGQWNGVMCKKTPQGNDEPFLDVYRLPLVKKQVNPVAEQGKYESRKLWRHVTAALKIKDVQKATEAKQRLEQRQQNEAEERATTNSKWETNIFKQSGENWIYRWPLDQRRRRSVSK